MASNNLPIKCNQIDHYTLIVPNAKQVSDFHVNVLGFQFMRIQLVNAGSAPEGKYDMLNYVLSWPNDPERVLVITEGMTKTSIFHRFMEKYGQGIHHIAFEVDNMEHTFNTLQEKGIPMTSDRIMNDLLTGLKQVFLHNEYTGVFVELIERPEEHSGSQAAESGFFTHDNMAGLAQTMDNYIEQQKLVSKEAGIEDYIPEENYYNSSSSIQQVSPLHYQIGIADLQNSSKFFSETLDLAIAQSSDTHLQLQLQNQSKPYLHCIPHTTPPHCELICQVATIHQASSILDELEIPYQKNEKNELTLDKLYAGYPLRLCEV